MLAVRIALFVAAGLCALAVASGPDYEKGKLLSFNWIQFSSIQCQICTVSLSALRSPQRPGAPYTTCTNKHDRFFFNALVSLTARKFRRDTVPGWLGSRLVSVLDSEGPGVTVLGIQFTPIVPLFTKQQNW